MCSDHLLYSYIIAGLNMIREMIKRWWMQLKAATNKGIEPEWQRCSRCVHVQSCEHSTDEPCFGIRIQAISSDICLFELHSN